MYKYIELDVRKKDKAVHLPAERSTSNLPTPAGSSSIRLHKYQNWFLENSSSGFHILPIDLRMFSLGTN